MLLVSPGAIALNWATGMCYATQRIRCVAPTYSYKLTIDAGGIQQVVCRSKSKKFGCCSSLLAPQRYSLSSPSLMLHALLYGANFSISIPAGIGLD